jgi:hypothetical protein
VPFGAHFEPMVAFNRLARKTLALARDEPIGV